LILNQGAQNIVSAKIRLKDTDDLYYAGFEEIRVKKEMITLATSAMNKITYLWRNSEHWMEPKSKHGREERILNLTILKPGNNPKNSELTS